MPHRISKGKGKRWKKGQSSSSNPVSKKHRDLAQRGAFNYSKNENKYLTAEGLAKHNAIQGEAEPAKTSDIDGESQVSQQTFATMWSECTNDCFSRLLKTWDPKSEIHREILAILAAVTEVIKSNNGKETVTEYFATLMTTLSTVESSDSLTATISSSSSGDETLIFQYFSQSEEMCSLFHSLAVISRAPRMPKPVLKAKFSLIDKELVDILNNHSDTDNGILLRSLIGCIGILLKCQEYAIWSLPSTLLTFQKVLSFCVHNKPKVRKSGYNAVCSILKGSDIVMNTGDTGISSAGENVFSSSIFWACFLAMWPHQTFHLKLNAKIINALNDFQPSVNDDEPLIAWLCVMKEAHTNLYRLDSNLAFSHFPHFFTTARNCFLSDKVNVHRVVFDCLKMLLTECILPHATQFKSELNSENQSYFPMKILTILENGLGFQYHTAWGEVLKLFSTFFEVLLSLADLRDSYKFVYTRELDHAVGMAIRGMGPQIFLQYVPLQLEDDKVTLAHFPRSWLLPVLRDNIQETELSYFSSYFVPLAKQIHARGEELKKENKIVEYKTLNILQNQIWSLLPGFCNKPTDLQTNFKGLARLLGDLLKERPDLRIIILTSIRGIIKSCDENVEDQQEISKYAKNYIPIFFNLYTTPVDKKGSVEDGIRLAVLETLKVYLSITNIKQIEVFFDTALKKQEDGTDSFTRHSLLDLLRLMLPYVDENRLLKLYELCAPSLESNDVTIQKKAYRILEELCSCKSDGAEAFISNKILVLEETLINSLSTAAPSSKAPRLRCLEHIIKKLDSPNLKIIQEIIPEVILCTKYGSEKSKRAAFDLISTMGEVMMKWDHKPPADILKDFIQLSLVGLQGSQQMVSASILALGTVIHQHKEHIDSGLLDMLISNICKLMAVPNREIVKSTLSFIKILLSILSEYQLSQYLSSLIVGLSNMTDDTRQHFRLKVKEILDRLTRKFGSEIISKMVPEKFEKVLKNIRKLQTRKAKKKALPDQEMSDMEVDHSLKKSTTDIDDLLQDTDEDEPSTSKSKNTAWIQESSANQIIDFLDPKASKNVSTSNPVKSSKNKNKFEKASDGRWIIDEENENDSKAPKGIKRKAEDSISVSEDEEDEKEEMPKSHYKSGGLGIHRPIKSAKREKDPMLVYKAKKAGGDVKKGQYDPFVYVKLDKGALNKRKQKKMTGRFDKLIKGAKKGSVEGKKDRKRHGIYEFDKMASKYFGSFKRSNNFDGMEPSEIEYEASLKAMPDLPSWISQRQPQKSRHSYLYGAVPKPGIIHLDIIALNRKNYKTFNQTITLKVADKTPQARYEVQLKFFDMNVEDMLANDWHTELVKIFQRNMWNPHVQGGKDEDVYLTKLASSVDMGFRLPHNPNEKEGVIVHIGSIHPFSAVLLDIENEVQPLLKHSPCPKDFRKTSAHRFFSRRPHFKVDWCEFRLFSHIENNKNGSHHHRIETPAPKPVYKSEDDFFQPPAAKSHTRHLLLDFVLCIVIPLAVIICMLVGLTYVMFCNREGIVELNQFSSVQRASNKLREMAVNREQPVLALPAPSSNSSIHGNSLPRSQSGVNNPKLPAPAIKITTPRSKF
ncbi:RRP12-like protein [Nymphon striatum]|nr:RRP12-like protein [Nymphon striatum]